LRPWLKHLQHASHPPTIPQGNTHATAIMIGERASDLVLAGVG
jgi:hypothetical protein